MSPVDGLSILLSLAGLLLFLGWIWPALCVDLHRQRLFGIRDRLFDLAATQRHGVSFRSPLYQQLRTTLNGQLRVGGTTGGLVALVLLFLRYPNDFPDVVDEYEELWERNGAMVSKEAREAIEALRDDLHSAELLYMCIASPIVTAAVTPAILFVFLREVVRERRARSSTNGPGPVSALRTRAAAALDTRAFHEGLASGNLLVA